MKSGLVILVTRIRQQPEKLSDAVCSRAEIKVGTQSPGQGLDQQSMEESGCNRAGDRHGCNVMITGKG